MTAPDLRTDRTTVRRRAERGAYDRATVHAILDEGLVAHVGVVLDAQPVVLPTAYCRVGDDLYLHGAPANRMFRAVADGRPVAITVTLLDGLVLARSAFHHSLNYRSVVILGTGARVSDVEEQRSSLAALVEHIAPGRGDGTRAPAEAELRKTLVVKVPIVEASAKVRTGGPVDDPGDLDGGYWAGVLPLGLRPGAPEPDPLLPAGVAAAVPTAVTGWRRGSRG